MNEINPNCETCPVHNLNNLTKLGVDMEGYDYVIALAGNPNTGKSTIFNNLTGLKQHTGNWPGKTVTRAEGGYVFNNEKYKIVDLPGTYSLLSTSTDEEVARNFILFGQPDVTLIVVDATKLERNLNLVLQILEITDRAVLALNLIDEAERKKIKINVRELSKQLGIPVVATAARNKKGMNELLKYVAEVAKGEYICKPHRLKSYPENIDEIINQLTGKIKFVFQNLPNSRWVALRLLEGDQEIIDSVLSGEIGNVPVATSSSNKEKENTPVKKNNFYKEVIMLADSLRWELGEKLHDLIIESIFTEAAIITKKVISNRENLTRTSWEVTLDKIVTSRLLGFPIMFFMLALVFWLTIVGANVPSAFLSDILIGKFHPVIKSFLGSIGVPHFINGLLIDGAYMAVAWVVSVMLPPMAIFFPLFTLLEDFGYLPRVAFNMDKLFQKAGAHGKQALTMSMGFGCNAAGVIATRVIDSPRERLIAIITNNFSLCNGRWPTQILLASIFIGSLVPAHLAGIATAGAVVSVALLGVFLSLAVSWGLSHSLLKGKASAFSLELPPYRPPRILQTLYTSLIDRTIFVLWRAIVFAIPAGMAIWLVANVNISGISLAQYFTTAVNPFAVFVGLNGIIILAYIIAIPANEIVIPTILMLTVASLGIGGHQAGVLFELDSVQQTGEILKAGGWSVLTAVNVMIFSLIHNPCSTTIYTIYKETGSIKWTVFSTLFPVLLGLVFCFLITQVWFLIG